jgi:hypothetical protein
MVVDPRQKKSFLAVLNAIFERKTVKGFVDRVKSFGDLELGLQAALRPHLEADDPLRLILFAPAQSVLAERQTIPWLPKSLLPWEITPERTLALTGKRLLVASTTRNAAGSRETHLVGEKAAPPPTELEAPEVIDIPLADLLYLESASVLLTSRFDATWVCRGQLQHIRIAFNTVSRFFFEELSGLMRQSILLQAGLELAPPPADGKGLEHLQAMPYKFRSLIPLHLLLPGEQIQAAAFQPSIWKTQPPFIRSHIAAKMALVRTAAHLILAAEELTSDEDSDGLTAHFCPLRSVRYAAIQGSPAGPELIIRLALGGVEHEERRPLLPASVTSMKQVLEPWL